MAPTRPELLMDAAGGLERLGVGRPEQVPVGGPAAAHAASVSAMVSEMRIATHEEAQALLQGSALPGGADSGADTARLSATLSALLDRLSATLPSSAALTPARHGVAGGTLDCALFAKDVRVRVRLGANDPHQPGAGAGPDSATALDVPIRCIAKLARTAPPLIDRQAARPALDQGTTATDQVSWQSLGSWVHPGSTSWVALAGSAVALAAIGLLARARTRRTRSVAARTTTCTVTCGAELGLVSDPATLGYSRST